MSDSDDKLLGISAADWVAKENADVLTILRELVDRSREASDRWIRSVELIRANPADALTELVEFRIALQDVGGAVTTLLEVYEEGSTLLDNELPDDESEHDD